MKKSYYILLTITATAAVLYLLGNWVGRSFGLNRQQVIRNIHEAYGRATDAFEAGQTKDLAAFFRNELDEVDLKRIKFRLDTVPLHGDSIVLKQDLRYFSDYRKLLDPESSCRVHRQTALYVLRNDSGFGTSIICHT